MQRFLFIIVVLCTFLSIAVSQGLNVQLVGQLRTRGASNYSNCWGYVAPNGREYAILGCQGGTQIVDITTDTLKEVGFITGPSSGWREMKVYQNYAYVVTEGSGAGLQIIDLSKLPDTVSLAKTITTTQVPSGHTISIEGKYLYINGSRYKNGGIVVLELTDPLNPKVVGEYEEQYVHDCVIRNDTIYAADIYGIGLDIIDATNKASIRRINLVQYPYSGVHNTAVSQNGKYIYTTDEINSDPNNNGNVLRVWDRTDIMNIKYVGSYVAKPFTIVHNLHVKGDYGFLAHYSEGLRILDLKNPAIPVEIASYDTYPGSVNGYVGAWGTFPYFTSSKAIISDMSGGLFVVKFPGQDGSIKVARTIVTVKDSVTGLPLSDVRVDINGNSSPLFTDVNGKFTIGSLYDTITVTCNKSTYLSGYGTKIEKLKMKYDSTITLTVFMKQMPSGSLQCTVTDKITAKPIKDFVLKINNTPVVISTDSTGKALVPSLLGGTKFTVMASQFGYKPDSVSITITGGVQNVISFSLVPFGVDDFERNLGWVVGSPQDSGKTGMWERAIPNAAVVGGDTLQPGVDHSANGVTCYVTGSSSAPTEYVDYRTTLTSPWFNPKSFVNPVVIYWAYFNTRSAAKDDTLYIQLSNDNGKTWKTAETIFGKQPRWIQHRIVMKDVLTVSEEMRIRFVAQDGGVSTVFDAAVDDVEFGDNLQLSVPYGIRDIPQQFSLEQNYPNPFNPSTVISYQLTMNSFVTLKVYDVMGKEVATLVNEQQQAGSYNFQFSIRNYQLSSGIYFYTIKTGNFTATKKLVLMK